MIIEIINNNNNRKNNNNNNNNRNNNNNNNNNRNNNNNNNNNRNNNIRNNYRQKNINEEKEKINIPNGTREIEFEVTELNKNLVYRLDTPTETITKMNDYLNLDAKEFIPKKYKQNQ